MKDAYQPPASIECAAAALKFRKIKPLLPVNHSILKSIVYPYSFERNSSAKINTELTPKIFKIEKKSMLNKGDTINGEKISVISKKLIKQDKAAVKKGSGTHKASFIRTKAYTFAKLERGYPTVPEKS